MRSSLLLVGLLGSLGTAACTGNFAPEGPDAEAASSSTAAVVVVSRSSGPGDALRDDSVVARFVRVTRGNLDESALRTAGVAQDIPNVGECRVGASAADGARYAGAGSSAGDREIDLADVGALTLTTELASPGAGAHGTALGSRSVPDPTGRISGVLYSAKNAEIFTSGAHLQVRATGGAVLPEGFAINVTAPRDLTDVRAQASLSGIDVSWDADDSDARDLRDLRDLVLVDVLDKSARLVARCATSDAGRFLVPSTFTASVDEGQVVVHRLHNEGFRAKGIEPGEVRFDVARVVTFRR